MKKTTTTAGDVRLLKIADAAERLSVCETTVYNLMNSGRLAWVRVGRARRVPAAALEKLVEANTHGGYKA